MISTRELEVSSWVARFRGGPCSGEPDHVFVVGPIWEEIELAPMPPTLSRPPHWVIVGGTGIGPEPNPWPGQVRYRLAELAGVDELGDSIAYYEVEEAGGSGDREHAQEEQHEHDENDHVSEQGEGSIHG
jgi:hypothetical protein